MKDHTLKYKADVLDTKNYTWFLQWYLFTGRRYNHLKIQSEAGGCMCIWDKAGLQEVVPEQAQKQYREILSENKKQTNK